MTDFKAKMYQIRFRFFGWGSAPDPAGGAYSAPPDPLAGFGGPTSKEREKEGRGGRGGEGGEGRRGKRRGGEGRGGERSRGKRRGGEGKERAMSPPRFGGSLRLCQGHRSRGYKIWPGGQGLASRTKSRVGTKILMI